MKCSSCGWTFLIFLFSVLLRVTGCRRADDSLQGKALGDITPPDITTLTLDDGVDSYYATKTGTLTWTAATDKTSGVSYYEVAVGTTPGGTDIETWTSVGSGLSGEVSSITLTRGTTYYASIRAVDKAGNTSAAVKGDGWFLN